MTTPLVDLFLRAVTIDAQSLQERPMADFVIRTLAGTTVAVVEDDAGKKINGTCGNLICVPESFSPSEPAVALFAHLDTPRTTKNVTPVVTDTAIASDGSTILGVDNRAGVAVLLHVLLNYSPVRSKANFIVVFTVAEEIGLFGSQHVDLAPYNIEMGFVFDCSKRPGTFIRSAVGCSLYDAEFIGKASHAAVAPEQGVNAIHMAAKAIGAIPVGRLSPTMTANTGMITGGEATNIVPDRCTIHGEVRSFNSYAIAVHLQTVEGICREAARDWGGDVVFSSKVDFVPFALFADNRIMRFTTDVLRLVGLAPDPIEYVGGSDANMLNAKGIPSVNLGIGAQKPHSNEEFILLEDLHKSAEIAFALLNQPFPKD